MKNVLLILVVIIVASFSSAAFGAKSPFKRSSFNREVIIKNLMVGVKSDNYGLRTSSALLLGEFKADEAVIELLSMLHREDSDDARIVAALSLLKINDSRGIYAIKQAIRFDKSDRVKRMCEKFYYHYLENKSN
ncbi:MULTISPECIES: HEAT repeat domain-containing protein [Ignavibacterium]|jgi:hypothetical protein|uniref:HEAT repeat domain-containing protein n=1 Tax=Ignavibacterium TaxID=795750 RepID=UPI0025C17081|nr:MULTISPECIES: HEAT repeat domain-containing protein [Ignavibacterium]MBI5661123.1 HEAT repeat domain-containing protein [Ignavibacterium album]